MGAISLSDDALHAVLSALTLSLKLACATTVILALIAIPLGYWLATTHHRFKTFLNALVLLPLVLPPTVLGFYLLVALGPSGWIGAWTTQLGLGLWSFRFEGLLLGSVIFSLPFAVQPIQMGFESLGRRPLDLARSVGASPVDAFITVALPAITPSLLTAAALTFTHTLGEFGVALMVGGNIEGRTRLMSLEIFSAVERMEYSVAHLLAAGLVLLSLLCLVGLLHLKNTPRGMP